MALIFVWLCGCATRFPVEEKYSLSVAPVDRSLHKLDVGYQSTLQIHWFGASCYLIQLGDKSILVDPYFSYQNAGRVLFSRISSDRSYVQQELAGLPIPSAIFISHTHFDHALDVATVHRQSGWQAVPIYGSDTAYNILRGYGSDVSGYWHKAVTSEGWHRCDLDTHVRYQAIPTDHGPQLPGVRLYMGQVRNPRTSPPTRAEDFKCGDTVAYLFELANKQVTFRIYMTAAPTSAPAGLPIRPVGPIDAAIICVADWRLARPYPDPCINGLHPHQIIASHFDDFLLLSGQKRAVIPYADLNRFVRHVQTLACYPEFQALRVPDVDSVLLVRKSHKPGIAGQ
jgi:L-ascorbate metabolism protein UlaG (beta-lactamase superfamily)